MTEIVRTIECEEAIRKLLEFLDNELPNHDHASVEKHLHTCRSCYSRMEFEKRLKGIVADTGEVPAPLQLRGKIKKITDLF